MVAPSQTSYTNILLVMQHVSEQEFVPNIKSECRLTALLLSVDLQDITSLTLRDMLLKIVIITITKYNDWDLGSDTL